MFHHKNPTEELHLYFQAMLSLLEATLDQVQPIDILWQELATSTD